MLISLSNLAKISLLIQVVQRARQVAKYIADRGESDVFTDQLTQLVFRHNVDKFTDGQIKTSWAFFDSRLKSIYETSGSSHTDDDHKNSTSCGGKIKREYPKGDTFTRS